MPKHYEKETDAQKRAKETIRQEKASIKRGSGGLKQASDAIKKNRREKQSILDQISMEDY